MPKLRIKLQNRSACYHCVSRIVDRRFIFDNQEKEMFKRMMTSVAGFCGVNVLTYSLMGNHFHVLVEVPVPRELDDVEFIHRLRCLYSPLSVDAIEAQLGHYRRKFNKDAADALKRRFTWRMYDLSEFMKSLKQRFSKWYNRHNGRQGTLWEERYRSVLVEDGNALVTIGAYIDLNATRAGLVDDPKEYRYCGYAEAVAGGQKARDGIRRIISKRSDIVSLDVNEGINRYRILLYETGCLGKRNQGAAPGSGFSCEEVDRVIHSGGKLTRKEFLRCRVRYFTDGMVLGSKEFVEDVFASHQSMFGKKRTSGARRVRAMDEEMFAMRDLQTEPVTLSKVQA